MTYYFILYVNNFVEFLAREWYFKLTVPLFLSLVIVYLVLGPTKLMGSSYEMTNGNIFIIWLFTALVTVHPIINKK